MALTVSTWLLSGDLKPLCWSIVCCENTPQAFSLFFWEKPWSAQELLWSLKLRSRRIRTSPWWSSLESSEDPHLFHFWKFGCNIKKSREIFFPPECFSSPPFLFFPPSHLISGNSCTHKHSKLTTDAGFCTYCTNAHTHTHTHKPSNITH